MTVPRRVYVNAPVVLAFAGLALLALALDRITGGWTTVHLFCVYRAPLTDPLTYVRLLGHVLGHSGWAHFIGNMLLLLVVGPSVEERYGGRALAAAIAVTAVVTGLVQMLFFPGVALMGASGVVFLLIVLSSFAGARGDGIPLTVLLVAVLYLGGEVLDAVTQRDQVSQLTHILGGLCGLGFGFAWSREKRR